MHLDSEAQRYRRGHDVFADAEPGPAAIDADHASNCRRAPDRRGNRRRSGKRQCGQHGEQRSAGDDVVRSAHAFFRTIMRDRPGRSDAEKRNRNSRSAALVALHDLAEDRAEDIGGRFVAAGQPATAGPRVGAADMGER